MHQPPQIQIDSVTLDDLSETFTDSFSGINFDGQVWRIEFCATRMEQLRMDQPQPPKILRGKRVPVCRLVLPPGIGFELATKLTALIQQMEKHGVIKRTDTMPMPPTSGKPN